MIYLCVIQPEPAFQQIKFTKKMDCDRKCTNLMIEVSTARKMKIRKFQAISNIVCLMFYALCLSNRISIQIISNDNTPNIPYRPAYHSCLYAIFSGHGDAKVAEIALERISAEILLGQLAGKTTEDEVKDVLRQAFVSAENGYMDWAGNFLAQKAMLQAELKGVSQYEISCQYKDIVRQLNYINDKLTIGASVVLALIHNQKLYICNVGNCRALLCKSDDNNVLRVVQLSVDHNLYNEDEILRLCQLGLDVASFKQSPFFTTRCIGNYIGKAGYQDCAFVSSASSEPIIAQPEIVGAIPMDESCRFLLLMSGGLCKTLQDVFPTDTIQVNKEIIQMTVEQFRVQSTLMGVSQSTVHKVVQMHHDAFMRQIEDDNGTVFNARDDITLLVRNFNFPMPNAIHKKHSQQHQVSFNPVTQQHVNSMFDTDSANIITTIDSQYTDTNSSSSYSEL